MEAWCAVAVDKDTRHKNPLRSDTNPTPLGPDAEGPKPQTPGVRPKKDPNPNPNPIGCRHIPNPFGSPPCLTPIALGSEHGPNPQSHLGPEQKDPNPKPLRSNTERPKPQTLWVRTRTQPSTPLGSRRGQTQTL
jgi:hypothetical protein